MIHFTEEETRLIRSTLDRKVTEQEFDRFMLTCKKLGLNPLNKEIYGIYRNRLSTEIGVNGARIFAFRLDPGYGSQIEWWHDGDWHSYPPASKTLASFARCTITKTSGGKVVQCVSSAEFGKTGQQWAARPNHMLGTKAELHALCAAYQPSVAALAPVESDIPPEEPVEALEPSSGPTLPSTPLATASQCREIREATQKLSKDKISLVTQWIRSLGKTRAEELSSAEADLALSTISFLLSNNPSEYSAQEETEDEEVF